MASLRESTRRVATATRLLLKDLLRRRIALVLLFVVPALFDAVVLATTAQRDIDVTLGSLVETGVYERTTLPGLDNLAAAFEDDGTRTLDERRLSLVFLGVAAVSFLACFLAFNLVHKRRDVDARLVLAGYRASEVLAAKLLVLFVLVSLLAGYETGILWPWIVPKQAGLIVAGFFFGGLIYGCLGMLVGALVKNELEGVFLIVFLTNIDAGWLQNPIYYAHTSGSPSYGRYRDTAPCSSPPWELSRMIRPTARSPERGSGRPRRSSWRSSRSAFASGLRVIGPRARGSRGTTRR